MRIVELILENVLQLVFFIIQQNCKRVGHIEHLKIVMKHKYIHPLYYFKKNQNG